MDKHVGELRVVFIILQLRCTERFVTCHNKQQRVHHSRCHWLSKQVSQIQLSLF